MPRPFPFPIGIGTDICMTRRIYRILSKPNAMAQRYIRMVLNPSEIQEHADRLRFAVELDAIKALGKEYPESQRRVIASKIWPLATFMSGRWAAKEAAIKAHTWRRITMHDITILGGVERENGRSTAPTMTIRAKNGSDELVAKITISHDGEYASAVCLAAEELEEPDASLPSGNTGAFVEKADSPSLTTPATPSVVKRPLTFSDLLGKR